MAARRSQPTLVDTFTKLHLFPLCLGIGLCLFLMSAPLWRDLEAAFDSVQDNGSYDFNEAASAMLTTLQQWLYDEGFDEAGDALDEEINRADQSE